MPRSDEAAPRGWDRVEWALAELAGGRIDEARLLITLDVLAAQQEGDLAAAPIAWTMMVVDAGALRVLQRLIETRATSVSAAVLCACILGREQVVHWLLREHGGAVDWDYCFAADDTIDDREVADVSEDTLRLTPLAAARCCRHVHIERELLHAGAG